MEWSEKLASEIRADREAWERRHRGEPDPPPKVPRPMLSGAEGLAAYRRAVAENRRRARQMEEAAARLGVTGYVQDATALLAQRLDARR